MRWRRMWCVRSMCARPWRWSSAARRRPIGGWLMGWFGVSVLFRWTGAVIAAGVMALPLMVRAMRLSIEAVDLRLEGAARTLGAGPARVFWTITLPLSVPGILAGAV